MKARDRHYLFVCSQNKLRSPTAEQIFADHPGIETLSAGTNHDAETPLDNEMLRWADTIFVMEKTHRSKIQQRFRGALGGRPDRISGLRSPRRRIIVAPTAADTPREDPC
ncbi:hypothetical protein [Sphingobium yanoikuyae]|uniref:hypothetical protein n=1 Tax=Sphingobium yanoikuyae TaxID=13690 RepID=UPI001F2E844F|nr:hypothetical protein [Sphingobium yanoikuyae]